MPRIKPGANPFYILLILAGIGFALTACAYTVMTVTEVHASRAAAGGQSQQSSFIGFLNEHGEALLAVELGLLGLATFAAIATDRFWARRAAGFIPADPRPPADTEHHSSDSETN